MTLNDQTGQIGSFLSIANWQANQLISAPYALTVGV